MKRLFILFAILATLAFCLLPLVVRGETNVWTEIPLEAKAITSAAVDVITTTGQFSVDFFTTGTYAVRSAVFNNIERPGFLATIDQGAFFTVRLPSGTTTIKPELACVATSGTVTNIGVVKWQVEYAVLSETSAVTTGTIAQSSRALESKKLEVLTFGEIDTTGAVYVIGRLVRDADAAADTCAKTAYIVGFGYWRKE